MCILVTHYEDTNLILIMTSSKRKVITLKRCIIFSLPFVLLWVMWQMFICLNHFRQTLLHTRNPYWVEHLNSWYKKWFLVYVCGVGGGCICMLVFMHVCACVWYIYLCVQPAFNNLTFLDLEHAQWDGHYDLCVCLCAVLLLWFSVKHHCSLCFNLQKYIFTTFCKWHSILFNSILSMFVWVAPKRHMQSHM